MKNPPSIRDETTPVNGDSTVGGTKAHQIQPSQTNQVKCGEQMQHFSSAFPQVLFISSFFQKITPAIGVQKTKIESSVEVENIGLLCR